MKNISLLSTLIKSIIPTPISNNPLITASNQFIGTRIFRFFIKIVGIPIIRISDLLSPFVIAAIVDGYNRIEDGYSNEITLLGMRSPIKEWVKLYGILWIGIQVLTYILNYIIEIDGVFASKIRLVEYIEHHDQLSLAINRQKPGAYIDEIKGIDNAVRKGVKLFFDIYSLMLESSLVFIILQKTYKRSLVGYFIIPCSVYMLSLLWDYYVFAGLSLSMKNSSKNFMGTAEEIITNYKTIHLFNARSEEESAYNSALRRQEKELNRHSFYSYVFSAIQKMILGYGFYQLLDHLNGQILDSNSLYKAGDFVIISAYYLKLISPLSKLGETFRDFFIYKRDFETFVNKLNTPLPNSGNLPFSEQKPPIIKFDKVNFSYPKNLGEDNKQALIESTTLVKEKIEDFSLKGVSFTIEPGEITAILGENGSGKSTIIDLLYRFYELDEKSGEIKINDANIKQIKLPELRSKIGISTQYAHIYSYKTIKENILYGRQEDSEAISVNQFLINKGLNLLLGMPLLMNINTNQRQGLSAGQAQQINFIRTFLKQPNIYIFDEPTSALDDQARWFILGHIKAFQGFKHNKIVIFVSHNPDDIKYIAPDHTITLCKGAVVKDSRKEIKNSIQAEVKVQPFATGLSIYGPSALSIPSFPHEIGNSYLIQTSCGSLPLTVPLPPTAADDKESKSDVKNSTKAIVRYSASGQGIYKSPAMRMNNEPIERKHKRKRYFGFLGGYRDEENMEPRRSKRIKKTPERYTDESYSSMRSTRAFESKNQF